MIKTFEFDDKKIVVDANSGSINIVDDIVYDILNEIEMPFDLNNIMLKLEVKYEMAQIEEAYNEIMQLIEEKLLFSPELDGEDINRKLKQENTVKALCLHVAHDCNLLCEYCFASKGSYKTNRSLMTEKVANRAIDFLLENSGSRKNVEVDFFGGEPILNFNIVKSAVRYGKTKAQEMNKQIHFTITTNATILDDEIIDFINENMDNVVISLDGRKEVNDSIRYDAFGNGTYDLILDNARKIVGRRGDKSYFIRGTYTSKNLDFSKDVIHIADCGFNEISVEPVVGAGEEFHIKEEHIDKIKKEYENLARIYVKRLKEGNSFRFYHFNINIYNGPCIYKRVTSCGAGNEYFAVTPEGDLYPCHQFVGVESFKVGNVFEGITKKEIKNDFIDANIFGKSECRNCWAKLYCSGGCHANAFFTNGSILKPSKIACELQKKRIECAIYVKTKEIEFFNKS